MDYILRAVNNGWILTVPPCDIDKTMPFGDFVFSNLSEVMLFLSKRHGEQLTVESE